MIDAHLHLDQYPAEEMDRLIEEWREAGIEGVVAVSGDLASSYRTLELKQQYPDFIYAAVGHHPEQQPPDEPDLNELLALIECEREQIAAVGEVGLPYYTEVGPLEEHQALLGTFLETAKKMNLPVALHAVHDSVPSVLRMLHDHKIGRAHFHWLKAAPDDLQHVVESGYHLSLTPEVCYRRRDQKLAELAPIEQLLLESDGPWPFSGPFRDRRTTPLFIKNAVKKIAELKNQSEKHIAEQTVNNTKNVYGRLHEEEE